MKTLRIVCHSLAAQPALRFLVFLLLAYLGAFEMVADAVGMNRFHDAQFLSAYERDARLSVLRYGQFPFWDPYSCGGLYGLAAPQTRYATPFFLFSLWLGVDPASSLLAVLLPALGMEGMFRYAKSWGASTTAAFLFAPLFPLSGWYGTAWRWGWVQFLSFCGLPWILFGLRRALRGSLQGAVVCAISTALTVGFGGTWTLPMGALLAVFELLDVGLPRLGRSRAEARARARFRPRLRVAAWGLAIASLLTLGVSAFRLWPMLESASATLRVMGGEPVISPEHLLQLAFQPATPDDLTSGSYYVSPLVVLGVVALFTRRALTAWAALLFTFVLSLGCFAAWAPFSLLRHLPVYDTMRYPERCLTLFSLAAALLSARGGSALLAWARLRFGRRGLRRTLLALLALLALALTVQIRNEQTLSASVTLDPIPVPHAAKFRQSRGNRWLMSHFAAEGLGALGCGEAYPLPMSIHLRGDLPAEEYLVDLEGGAPSPALGSVERVRWTPNRLTLRVTAKRAVRLAVNQNYHPGWRSSAGEVESWDGLLSVRLPPGTHLVELRFAPRSGIGGLWVSLLSLGAGLLLVGRRHGSRRFQAACALCGPALWALLLVVWPEPPWVHPPPFTPDDAPVLRSALPPDASLHPAQFAVPLRLEASRLPSAPLPADAREVWIDLYFRREGKLSPSLGIFVHLEGPSGRRMTADHTEISGQLYLPRIPLGQIAHDRFRVALPKDAEGEWRVRVGLWNTYGDGARQPIVSLSSAEQHDNAVQIGAFTVGP